MFELNSLLNVLSLRTGAAARFEQLLDWKLLRGSHEFPGPDGGTCINEAAIVAAGYAYRPVYCVKDMPASFSRPIAMFALCLNDSLDDVLRQELLIPFVARLGSTADTPRVEMMRAELMWRRMVADILTPALAEGGFAQLAREAGAMRTPTEFVAVARRLRSAAASTVDPLLLSACEHAADGASQLRAGLPTEVVFCTFSALRDIASLADQDFEDSVYCRAAAILDAALEIGNQSEQVGVGVVVERMNDAKRRYPSEHRSAGAPAAA